MPCTSRTFRRLVRNLKGGINSDWQDTRIFPINTECKNCHQQESKSCTTFSPHAFRAKGDSMCHVYPVEDCGKELHGNFSNYHTRNMTPSHTSRLATNFRSQPFYKSAESWNFSYLLVFKSCYEGELHYEKKKWTLKDNFVKSRTCV